MKYRSRSDIVGLLLDAANGGRATKTKLMYKAYLSFNQLREYLTLLVENGLIEYEVGQTYRTTEKGYATITSAEQNRRSSSRQFDKGIVQFQAIIT